MKEEFKQDRNKTNYGPNEWLKFIIITLVSALLVYKIAISDLIFDFSDLLALLLALFAIGLSVLFYFKATDTSNQFYDNTYKFTKEISEILGRIEAGFGERLRHLDEGYSGLANKIDHGPEPDQKETRVEIEKEKQKLKNEIDERNQILNNLLEKAQLEKHEKEEIRNQLKEKELEIAKQNRELSFLKSRLYSDNEGNEINEIPDFVKMILTNYVKTLDSPEVLLKYPISIIHRKYKLDFAKLTKSEVALLTQQRILENDGTFSVHGIKLLKQIARSYF